MGLKEYRRKRDFTKTSEPRGKRAREHKKLAYVIQKHAASHLHYDFRLELDGVLKSWAVPKGPDLDPSVKRLAMHVEDHPLEYGKFEGTIPKGEYGGGTVMLWDRGTWEPVGDADKDYREGRLKFVLHGKKLRGKWMLVRRGGRNSESGERHWFLFKERDEFARKGESITEDEPLSVTSGRDLDEIASRSRRVWGSDGETTRSNKDRRSAAGRQKKTAHLNGRAKKLDRAALEKLLTNPAARARGLPKSQAVELATLAKVAPSGDEWLHEIKLDGYRMLCRIDGGNPRFISRNGNDWTSKFPELARAAARLPVKQAMLDGEVVAMDPDGTTHFQSLQNIFQSGRTGELVFYAFDVLHLDGRDVTTLPLVERKEILKLVVDASPDESIQFSEHIEGTGPEIFAEACRMHLEGIVSKRRDSPYRPGRGADWLKIKCSSRAEFVIGGYTPPEGSRHHFGALLVGYYDKAKNFVYAGRVGTGFSDKTLATLHKKLKELEQAKSPFVNLSGTTGQARGVRWLQPRLVAEVEFSNWTDEQLLRHPSFQGLREDKAAKDVVRDTALSGAEVKELQRKTTKATRNGRTKKSQKESAVVAGITVSHPDRVVYPDAGITKLDVAKYYEGVAPWMLPHVAHRVLALVRCPQGVAGQSFFQKHPGEGASKHWLQIDVAESGKPDYNVAVKDAAGLVALAQMGVLEIHIWGSLARKLGKPDRLIFDLDPDPAVQWSDVVKAAREVRLLLEELGLESFVKTTGGKGLHVVVPVEPRLEWDEAKAFSKAVADLMVRAAPNRYIATMSKAARKGKIFVDYLRNGRGATSIAPYSTRARAGATVSVPISWEELGPKLRSDEFTIADVPARLAKLKKDPWAEIGKVRQSITKAMIKRLEI